MARTSKKENATVTKVEVPSEPVEQVKKRSRKSVDPNELRKTNTALSKENAELKIKLEQAKMFIESINTQKQQLERTLNALQIQYTGITEYVKKTLEVYHQSVLMAFKEEIK